MAVRNARAEWRGKLREGSGTLELGSGAYKGPYSFQSRFESGDGTNPEELIGAAHAGCFSMALAAALTTSGFNPATIRTTAKVHLQAEGGGFSISRIELSTEAEVPEITAAVFQEHAEGAKANCPVSKALAGTRIELTARLI